MIDKLDSSYFTFELWEAGSFLRMFGFHVYVNELDFKKKEILRKYVVGYCDAESLNVRPKTNCKAVMFFYGGDYFWSHLTNEEFEEIFKEMEK